MAKIKFCGLKRPCDIDYANVVKPDYVGFVFAKKSSRYISLEEAGKLRSSLSAEITPVGVFVNEKPEIVAEALKRKIIDIAQLHGSEGEEYISVLRSLTDRPVIKAFRIENAADVEAAERCTADFVLLDSGSGGTGTVFDWSLLKNVRKRFFMAGGLDARNVKDAVFSYQPYAVDVSSGIETDGMKDPVKMEAFIKAVREG